MDTSSGQFFIADRLRGIPLVSRQSPKKEEASTQRANVQLEKRNADKEVTSSLLFKPSAMTASTANIVRKKTTTTTTTRKPPTTRRPSRRLLKSEPALAKLIKDQVRPAKMVSSTTETTTSLLFQAPEPTPRLQNLTRSEASQILPTTQAEAGYQRRTTQTISSPHFTNRPYDSSKMFAGENWVLFNKANGQFSMFETMVLMANVLIVSTIVLVTIISWIKSFKKKRAATQAKQEPIKEEALISSANSKPNNSRSDSQAFSDRTSKISLISSATSAPTTTTASEAMQTSLTKPAVDNLQQSSPIKLIKTASEPKSEPPAKSSTIASKATAIVQPSENNVQADAPSKQLQSLKEELSNQSGRTINRSVSDLSNRNNSSLNKPEVNKTTDALVSDEKASKLENPLNNSTPNMSFEIEPPKKLVSVGSLESIELPESLVGPEAKNAAGSVVAPSPNLLLGEKNPPPETITISATIHKEASGPPKPPKEEEKPQTSSSADVRPENPMGRDASSDKAPPPPAESAGLKNHQMVVNKLDKRKTNLEIVDIRDESVTGKMREKDQKEEIADGWISMDGVAVVQAAPSAGTAPQSPTGTPAATPATTANQILSPSEIIETRFHVDYKSNAKKLNANQRKEGAADSMDSKAEENLLNNIDIELEQDNKMRNRKYFVYVVHDGHFTAKKECIARIELPQKRRVTLAELRSLIANSQDVSLSSLRKSKFKFVTETYRLLTENEDAAVLHQVYPTQGVFLKLNIPEQENPIYPYKISRTRLMSSTSGLSATTSSLAHTTIASRRRAAARGGGRPAQNSGDLLPAIEVNGSGRGPRASSVGRRAGPGKAGPLPRSKSSVQARAGKQRADFEDKLPAIGRLTKVKKVAPSESSSAEAKPQASAKVAAVQSAASEMISGAKKLFNATFNR